MISSEQVQPETLGSVLLPLVMTGHHTAPVVADGSKLQPPPTSSKMLTDR